MNTITYFQPDQLKQIAADALSTIPPGRKYAVVGTVDSEGAKIVAGFKLDADSKWQFAGAFEHEWETGDNKIGATIIWSA